MAKPERRFNARSQKVIRDTKDGGRFVNSETGAQRTD